MEDQEQNPRARYADPQTPERVDPLEAFEEGIFEDEFDEDEPGTGAGNATHEKNHKPEPAPSEQQGRSTHERKLYDHARPTVVEEKNEAKKNGRSKRAKKAIDNKIPKRWKNPNSFQVRLRTGVVYVTLSVLCIMISNETTMLFLAATAGVCAGEFYYMCRSDAKMPNEIIGIIAAVLYPVATWFIGIRGIVYVTLLFVLVITIWYVYWMRARMADVGICLFGAVYTGMQLCGLQLVRQSIEQPWGGLLVLMIFFSIWMNDAAAYMFGSRFGRHKLAPRTSPNKSWEGFWMGLVVGTLLWIPMTFIPGVNMDVYQALVFGMLCSLTSVLGDLCESRIKRSVGFKDSGTIMPGHGGLFDRCDSLMPTAVVSAVLLFSSGCLPAPF